MIEKYKLDSSSRNFRRTSTEILSRFPIDTGCRIPSYVVKQSQCVPPHCLDLRTVNKPVVISDSCGPIIVKESYTVFPVTKRFNPSAELVRLFKIRMSDPYSAKGVQGEVHEIGMDDFVIRNLNGTLVNMARRHVDETGYTPFQVCNNDTINTEFRNEIIDRLGIDINDLKPLLERLVGELKFSARRGINNKWGKIFFDTETNSVIAQAVKMKTIKEMS